LAINIELPAVSKSIHIDEIKTAHYLTEQPGIYVFYDIDDRPLYAGKSINLFSRLKSHKSKSKFFPKAYRVNLYYVENAAERDIYETYIISTFSPEYNREKVYVNTRAKSDELYGLETEIETIESELDEILQELKFQDWTRNKYNGCSDDYLHLRARTRELSVEIKSLKARKAEIIRKYFK
jgi:hypothetical protein